MGYWGLSLRVFEIYRLLGQRLYVSRAITRFESGPLPGWLVWV